MGEGLCGFIWERSAGCCLGSVRILQGLYEMVLRVSLSGFWALSPRPTALSSSGFWFQDLVRLNRSYEELLRSGVDCFRGRIRVQGSRGSGDL